jgi:hypothetical protein
MENGGSELHTVIVLETPELALTDTETCTVAERSAHGGMPCTV